MRKVHDIKTNRKGGIISFVQWGNPDDGYIYECICPFCGKTAGWVDDREDEFSPRGLNRAIGIVTSKHVPQCQFNGSGSLAVEKVAHIPGVEVHRSHLM